MQINNMHRPMRVLKTSIVSQKLRIEYKINIILSKLHCPLVVKYIDCDQTKSRSLDTGQLFMSQNIAAQTEGKSQDFLTRGSEKSSQIFRVEGEAEGDNSIKYHVSGPNIVLDVSNDLILELILLLNATLFLALAKNRTILIS